MLAQSHTAANAAEDSRSVMTNNANGDALEQSARRSTSSARASPSQAQNCKEHHDSIAVSQQDAVRALRKYTTLTNTEIFRRVGVSASGGYRYLRREDIKDKETRGRKRKLDESVVNRIINEIESQPVGEKTRSWEELCKMAGVEGVAPVTLKRAVESAGYYKCSHCQRGTFTGSWMRTPMHVVAYQFLLFSSHESSRHGQRRKRS
jgi:transposase